VGVYGRGHFLSKVIVFLIYSILYLLYIYYIQPGLSTSVIVGAELFDKLGCTM